MRLLAFIFLLSTTITCFAQDKNVLNYIKDHAIVIDTNLNDLKDIALLKDELDSKRIIGVGKATHGTHEFHVAKFRIFKYLVTELHYKIFGLEAGFAESLQVNNYILNGNSDPRPAIR